MADRVRKAATATTKIDPDLLREAKKIAALREVSLTDYLDSLIRRPIKRDHEEEMNKIRDKV
jgi:hypothetical protein